MLKITIPGFMAFNENTGEIINVKECTIAMEHSLVSLKKWESKWEKPFISSDKTAEEMYDYFRCMTITQNVDPLVYYGIDEALFKKIDEYINSKQSATVVSEVTTSNTTRKPETITAELLYYWMIELGIPVEFQKWHLNSLITLIRVCQIKKAPPKKMSVSERKALNKQRRAKYHSKG